MKNVRNARLEDKAFGRQYGFHGEETCVFVTSEHISKPKISLGKYAGTVVLRPQK